MAFWFHASKSVGIVVLCSIHIPYDVFGANRGPRPSADGLASPTKIKTFWVIKYLNIYSTNK